MRILPRTTSRIRQGPSVFVGTKIGSSCHSGQAPEFSLIPHCMLYVSDLNTGFSKLLSGLGLQVGFERFLSQNKIASDIVKKA